MYDEAENTPEVEVDEVAATETEVTAESAPANDSDSVEEPQKNRVQERINKITAEKYEERRKREELEKKLAELEARIAQPVQLEPKLEEFDYDDHKYQVELARYHAQKAAQDAVKQYQQDQEAREAKRKQKEIQERFNKKVESFRETAPDYDQVVGSLPLLPAELMTTIMESEKGPQIAHFLGKHLDVTDMLINSSPIQAAVELGKIAQKLSAEKPKQPSKAPDPINPLPGNGSTNKDELQYAKGATFE